MHSIVTLSEGVATVETGAMKTSFRVGSSANAANQIAILHEIIIGLRATISTLPATVHERRCHDCGHVGLHADTITPYVLCPKCGSQDTRATNRELLPTDKTEL